MQLQTAEWPRGLSKGGKSAVVDFTVLGSDVLCSRQCNALLNTVYNCLHRTRIAVSSVIFQARPNAAIAATPSSGAAVPIA